MIDYNYHQHTLFSDGHDEPEAYCQSALELGMTAIGFSEHSPLPFGNPFSLPDNKVEDYVQTIEELKEDYKGSLTIYRALEMDYIPGMSEDFDYWRNRCKVDYLIGSVHLVKPDGFEELWFTDGPDYKVYDQGIIDFFGGDAHKAVTKFYQQTNEMIETQNFEVIGHFDKIKMHNHGRYFHDSDVWYRKLIDETVDLIKQKDLIVEINTRGIYKKRCEELFPDAYALQRVKELEIPVIISSDAHQPQEQMMLFDNALNRLKESGFNSVMKFIDGSWIENTIS